MNNAHTFNPFLCLNTIHNGSQAAVLVGCGVSNPADILRGEAPRPSTCWRGPWTVRALSFATRRGGFRPRVWTRIRPRFMQNNKKVKPTWS